MTKDQKLLLEKTKELGDQMAESIEIYLQVMGWIPFLEILYHIAEKREEGRAAGMFLGSMDFLKDGAE